MSGPPLSSMGVKPSPKTAGYGASTVRFGLPTNQVVHVSDRKAIT